MDSLNTILNSGTYGDSVSRHNDNYTKIKQSLTGLENVAFNPLTIKKTYMTFTEAEADTNPIGDDGLAIKIGQIVSVTSANKIYKLKTLTSGVPTWESVGTIGDLTLKADHGYSSSPKTLKQVEVQLAGESSFQFTSLFDHDYNIATAYLDGYISKTTGQLITGASSWKCTDYLVVNRNCTFIRISNDVLEDSTSAAAIAFYDKNKNYLGYIQAGEYIEFSPFDHYANCLYIRVSGTLTPKFVVKALPAVAVNATDSAYKLNFLIRDVDFAISSTKESLTETGNTSAGESWRCTDYIPVQENIIVKYKGVTTYSSFSIIGYDSNKNFVSVILGNLQTIQSEYYTYKITNANIKYVRASSRMIAGDVFSFIVPIILEQYNRDYFIPKKIYAKEGERIYINPSGIVAIHPEDYSADIVGNLQLGNEKSIIVDPSSIDKSISIYGRNRVGARTKLGSMLVKVTPIANISSPTTPQNFICLGDSLTLGVSSSGIEGAYVNELSRRLTGIGTELLTGSESQAALSLDNIYFRGTLGNQPVKHEGRGGWSADDYLSTSSGNAFWNPTTNKFDVNYYLSNNNFTSSLTTGGVDATGSNLTFIILLGWNSAYNGGAIAGADSLKLLIDKIHADVADVKIKIIGLNTPPPMNYKTFTGERYVSPESIMSDVIIPFNKAYQAIEDNSQYSSFVEFVPISQSFFSDDSYPSQDNIICKRNSSTIKVYTDYVHPNARGYAQIADVLFYNILYNYCKL